jgi:ATP-binding cassette subfamily F protein uup
MALVSMQNVSLSFTGTKILEDLNIQIEKGQRICLLGRNGVGKTTLMRTLAGELKPDFGSVQVGQGVKIAYFSQSIPQNLCKNAYEIIAEGLGEKGKLANLYHKTEKALEKEYSAELSDELEKCRSILDKNDAWSCLDQIGKIMSRMGIDSEWEYDSLSGGQKRRVILASALVCEPDVILLDEPTNHLDIETIAWLEDFLLRLSTTMVFVTHDRMLLRRLATRIIELDRGKLYDWTCDYDTFLRRKAEVLAAEEKDWERFDKKLAQEEIWIRRGIEARRTRNEGRVRALKKMREERKQRRERIGTAKMKLMKSADSGFEVIEAENISFSYGEKQIIKDFSLRIVRGDKIGIVGANGCGKTTLVKLLLGELKPTSGSVELGTNLHIMYYDQLRAQLDENKTVWENVSPDSDQVILNGKPQHIVGYLQNFLFSPERAKTKISVLSGGEKNRVLLAKLFVSPANLLVLDEPTNDLDIETLELLEELISDFQGTVLLICHDRTFLNNVVSSTLVFAENGEIKEIVGGYDEWLEERKLQSEEKAKQAEEAKNNKTELKNNEISQNTSNVQKPKKLSFKEKQELAALPKMIEDAEKEVAEIQAKLSDPLFYKTGENPNVLNQRISELEDAQLNYMERLEELQARQ